MMRMELIEWYVGSKILKMDIYTWRWRVLYKYRPKDVGMIMRLIKEKT